MAKPSRIEKNNLPEDVRKAFNEGVEIYQLITNYENGFLNEKEFIFKIRKIKEQYT